MFVWICAVHLGVGRYPLEGGSQATHLLFHEVSRVRQTFVAQGFAGSILAATVRHEGEALSRGTFHPGARLDPRITSHSSVPVAVSIQAQGPTAAVFLTMTLSALWHLRWVPRLPALDELLPLKTRIRCSVVITARDEAARIEQTIRRLIEERGVELEIIVVDDRSIDRTGEILQRLALEDSRTRLKRVEVLPEGWLGKCHACHIGASAATGDWILMREWGGGQRAALDLQHVRNLKQDEHRHSTAKAPAGSAGG